MFKVFFAKRKAKRQMMACKLWAGWSKKDLRYREERCITVNNYIIFDNLYSLAKRANGYFVAEDYIGVESAYLEARKIVDSI